MQKIIRKQLYHYKMYDDNIVFLQVTKMHMLSKLFIIFKN